MNSEPNKNIDLKILCVDDEAEILEIFSEIISAYISKEMALDGLELLKKIAREIHTLKGSNGCLPVNIITKYVHKYEGIISSIQRGEIHIKISDDGRGIDYEKIKKKALEKSLYTQKQLSEMNEKKSILILNSLLVEVNKRCFAIPQDSIVKVLQISQEQARASNYTEISQDIRDRAGISENTFIKDQTVTIFDLKTVIESNKSIND